MRRGRRGCSGRGPPSGRGRAFPGAPSPETSLTPGALGYHRLLLPREARIAESRITRRPRSASHRGGEQRYRTRAAADWTCTSGRWWPARYHRLARRLGAQKAAVAVARSLLVIVYHLLTSRAEYADLGGDYFDRLDREALERRHVRGLEQLGYTVSLQRRVA